MKEPEQKPKNYALTGAIIFGSVEVFIMIVLLLWSLQASIFSYSGGSFILFFTQMPGVLLTKLFKQAGNLESSTPYAIAFFINIAVYSGIGYYLGNLFHKKGWLDEVENVFLTEEEVYQKEEKV
jgi:hypothetical protein